ncbi:hypothetical protein C1T31_12335 [Hanstruepera neustonica]|uniref:Uncharacterized protein n=1 Tax=Hanstruepera neustonica TaxID=1445657 RepID=A0A2K1DWB9_9FLAO|nr:hypothetical protein [Hanstruepera neustonica]PNQ72330.1 hypothetical protein C1T31_12335 [Hanstruepera neustonica]
MEAKEDFIKKLLEVTYNNYGDDFQLALIPEKYSKQVISYGSMKVDLISVLDYLNELKKTENTIFESSFMYSAISIYGRCFTSSKDYTQLNVKQVFGNNSIHLKNHEYLRNLRDRFIAHRRKTEFELGAAFIAVSKSNPEKATMKFQQMRIGSWSVKRIDELIETVNYVLIHVEKKFESCGLRLYDKILENYSTEEIESFFINHLFE